MHMEVVAWAEMVSEEVVWSLRPFQSMKTVAAVVVASNETDAWVAVADLDEEWQAVGLT